MSEDRHRRVKNIFLAACETRGDAREELLARKCGGDAQLRGEVEALLAFDESSEGFMDTPAELPLDAETRMPEEIGGYRVLHLLGTGGMGTVYAAEQGQPRRQVALKIMRTGLDTKQAVRRFYYESELLGRLQHPAVAQVYDAGTADLGHGPQPFFAMELVEGQSLTDHAESRRLQLEARLELLTRVCDGVEHAHQKGVIHRDLKPSNILVTEAGLPKILDFGIARTVDADVRATRQTQTGQVLGTLATMSPEQAAGDLSAIDTRTDVYALGVILYELITGRLPIEVQDRSVPAALRAIAEEEPAPMRLRESGGRVPEDLVTVTLTALEKDRNRRYASASALAADLRRFMAHEPIEARTPSAAYRVRKFVQRNPTLTASLVTGFLVLVAGLALTSWQYLIAEERRVDAEEARGDAEERRAEAEHERDMAAAVLRFFTDVLQEANPDVNPMGRDMSVPELLTRAAERIETAENMPAEVEIALRQVIGRGLLAASDPEGARRHVERALELARGRGSAGRLAMADALTDLAQIQRQADDIEGATKLCDDAAVIIEDLGAAAGMQRRFLRYTRAMLHLDSGEYAEAEELLLEGIAEIEGDQDSSRQMLAEHLNMLGLAQLYGGNAVEAEKALQKGVLLQRDLHGPETIRASQALQLLGVIYYQRGDLADAEKTLRDGVELMLRRYGDESSRVVGAMMNHAVILRNLDRLEESAAVYERAVPMAHKAYGEKHTIVATLQNNLGRLEQARGNLEHAEELMQSALAMRAELLGAGHPETLAVEHNLAKLEMARENYPVALERLEALLARRRETLGADHQDVGHTLDALGRCLMKMAETARARDRFAEALPVLAASLGKDSPHTDGVRQDLARALLELGEPEDAAALALVAHEHAVAREDAATAKTLAELLVRIYDSWGQPAEAARWR